jgi:hypothetical protein
MFFDKTNHKFIKEKSHPMDKHTHCWKKRSFFIKDKKSIGMSWIQKYNRKSRTTTVK